MTKSGEKNSYTGEAVSSIRARAAGTRTSRRELRRSTATVTLDESRVIKLDSSGQPVFKVTFGY